MTVSIKMALADRRPIGFPVSSASTIPSFNPNALNVHYSVSSSLRKQADAQQSSDVKEEDEDEEDFNEQDIDPMSPEGSMSSVEASPTLRSISPDSLLGSDGQRKLNSGSLNSSGSITSTSSRGSSPSLNVNSLGIKKSKGTPRVPIATGISTKIPVTGEKPRPCQKDDPSLEDDVLYAIFIILFERDPEGSGMTVKQICDILIEQHPEMANLSTKTSNLVSAKLNAYVKRVEKGDSSLKYALSRDWADASPKRMVYVYRGLLTEDFHLHVKTVMEDQKVSHRPKPTTQQPELQKGQSESPLDPKRSSWVKQRRQTMFDLGTTKNTFLEGPLDKSNLFVPYASAPVAASLTEAKPEEKKPDQTVNAETDLELDDIEVFHDDDDINIDIIASESEFIRKNGKRSKSLSSLNNKKAKILTAAAAAPRAPRAPCSHSPNAAAAAAALHAAAIKAISNSSYKNGAAEKGESNHGNSSHSLQNKKWLNVVRSGFLTQDIGTPEDISLSDLDKLFT